MPRALVALSLTIVAAFGSAAATPRVEDVPVPGGRPALAAALGLVQTPDAARFITEVARAVYETPDDHGRDADSRAARLGAYLTTAARAGAASPRDLVPVPLTAAIWSRAIFKRTVAPAGLVAAILADRSAALVCHGLAALDDDTLSVLADHPDALTRIYARGAGAFAVFADGLRVAGGRVLAPGDADAAPLWNAVVGESTAEPERFIPALFAQADGRTAYFYAMLARADRATTVFALGLDLAEPAARLARFRAVVASAAHAYAEWDVESRPFARPVADAAMLLAALHVDAAGAPALSSRVLWSRAFARDALPGDPGKLLEGADAPIDMAWLSDAILDRSVGEREERLDQFAFGERVFASAGRAGWPDVLVALRAFPRVRMLMLTLERIGVTRPEVYAAAARVAGRLTGSGSSAQAFVALAEFQGALGLVTRMARVGELDARAAGMLAERLIGLPFDGGRYGGAMSGWMRDALGPALPPADGPEAAILDALAGVGRPARDRARVEWEGQRYHLDLAEAERRRLERVREKQGGATVDVALDLDSVARAIGAAGLTLDAVRAASASLTSLARRLAPSVDGGDVAPLGVNEGRSEPDAAARLARRLAAAATPGDFHRAAALASPIADLADRVLAQALLSLNYAAELGDPDGAALFAGNVAARHDFGFGIKEADLRVRTMWMVPRPDLMPGVPWHVKGSLLGLDLALASLQLRRVAAAPPAEAPAMTSNDRDVFTASVALMNPWALADADRDAIAAAVARGRARVAALAGADPAGAEDAIDMDGWRRRALAWTLAHDPARAASFFSMTELVELGGAPPSAFDAWGMSAMPARGCICTRMPPHDRWRTAVGRPAVGLMATAVADLNLNVAVALADLHLPAALARAVLTAAVQDFIDEARPIDANDWLTLVRSAQAVARERIEDYVAAAAADGPLVPDDAPGR